jgi:transposase-like protein
MPAPLDTDLRLRVVQTYEGGDATVEEVAERFCVGPASLKRLVWQWRATGSVEPKERVGGCTHPQMLPVPRKHLHCRPPAHLDRELVGVQPLV